MIWILIVISWVATSQPVVNVSVYPTALACENAKALVTEAATSNWRALPDMKCKAVVIK